MKEESPSPPFNPDLIDDFCDLYESCTMDTTGCIDYDSIMLRDFFGANQDYATGLDPLPAYLAELSNRGYRLRHNHNNERVIFVRQRFTDYEEIPL